MRAVLACALLLAACGPCPTPAKPGATADAPADVVADGADGVADEWTCARYGVMGLHGVRAGAHTAPHPGLATAQQAYDAALAAAEHEDDLAAAGHFLACARALREVPDDDAQRDTAERNADICYYDAMVAFANAGRFESDGRAQLEQAATDDPRLAAKLREYLADPLHDCAR